MSAITFHLPPWFWPIWHLEKDALIQTALKWKKKKKKSPMERNLLELNSDINALKYWLGYKYTYKQWNKSFYHILGNSNLKVSILKGNGKTSYFNLWHSSCVHSDKLYERFCLCLTFRFTYAPQPCIFTLGKRPCWVRQLDDDVSIEQK